MTNKTALAERIAAAVMDLAERDHALVKSMLVEVISKELAWKGYQSSSDTVTFDRKFFESICTRGGIGLGPQLEIGCLNAMKRLQPGLFAVAGHSTGDKNAAARTTS